MFPDGVQKLVFALSIQKIDNTVYLFEGSLFRTKNTSQISCEYYRACSVSNSEYLITDSLINEFKNSFDQFIMDAVSIKITDSKMKSAEMQSGIVFL